MITDQSTGAQPLGQHLQAACSLTTYGNYEVVDSSLAQNGDAIPARFPIVF